MHEFFQRLAVRVSKLFGSPWSFVSAISLIIVWAMLGPIFGYSDTWQLFINTFTTVMTFLTVFLIQNTQNRDTKAIHIKLDELLKSVGGARNSLVGAEELSDKELDHLLSEFRELHQKYAKAIEKRGGKLKLAEIVEENK